MVRKAPREADVRDIMYPFCKRFEFSSMRVVNRTCDERGYAHFFDAKVELVGSDLRKRGCQL